MTHDEKTEGVLPRATAADFEQARAAWQRYDRCRDLLAVALDRNPTPQELNRALAAWPAF